MTGNVLIFAIGFSAQFFYFARTAFQWFKTERSGTVASPVLYWIFSIAGAYLLCIYGWLRNDFAVILGPFITYYIYLWNLYLNGFWKRMHVLLRIILICTPLIAAAFVLRDADAFVESFFRNDGIPIWLLLFGSAGQILFTLRFVYQLGYSVIRHKPDLPMGFWIISLVGAAIVLAYGIFRLDPVLIVGQMFSFIAYYRNLTIGIREKKAAKK